MSINFPTNPPNHAGQPLAGPLAFEINFMTDLIHRAGEKILAHPELTLEQRLAFLRAVTLAIKCLESLYRANKEMLDQEDDEDLDPGSIPDLPFSKN